MAAWVVFPLALELSHVGLLSREPLVWSFFATPLVATAAIVTSFVRSWNGDPGRRWVAFWLGLTALLLWAAAFCALIILAIGFEHWQF